MTSKRLHTVLMASLVLLFAALLGGTYAVNKLLTKESDDLVKLKAKSQALVQEQTILNKAKKDAKKYENLNKIAQAVVPQDKNQAEAVQQIVNIAAANGVTLASITFPASTLGNLPGGAAKPAGPGTSTGAASVPAPSGGPGGNKSANLSQLTALKNIPGVYQLPITISNDSAHPVQYERFINFLSDLEHNRRTSQVQTISIDPDPENPAYLTFSLTLNEYIKP